MFERIRSYYSKGLWTADMVRQAAGKGLLSEEQCRQIVGPPEAGAGEERPQAAGQQAENDREEAAADG